MFIDFDTSGDPQLREMLEASEQFVRDIYHDNQPRHWLSLLGNSGVGKTMLARAILRWAHKHQENKKDPTYDLTVEVKYRECGMLKWSQCCNYMINGDYGWLPQAKRDWLLVIDDIGVEYDKVRALANSKLYEILEARRGRWTVITANMSLEQVGTKVDPRVASRLLRDESVVIEVEALDYAVRQHRAKKAKRLKP